MDEGKSRAVSFSFDGKHYEDDLTNDDADGLREAFSDYVVAARKVSDRQAPSGSSAPKRGNSDELAKIREWGQRERARRFQPRPRQPGRPRRVRHRPLAFSTLPRATLVSSTARPELRPDRYDTNSPAVLVRPSIAASYARWTPRFHLRRDVVLAYWG